MSAKAKGNRRERQARKILEEHGYRTSGAKNHKWGATDYFGLFDIIAVHPVKPVKFVQVKANGTGGQLRRIGERASRWLPPHHAEVEFWICHDREGWRVKRLNVIRGPETTQFDWQQILDERKRDGNMGEHVPETF